MGMSNKLSVGYVWYLWCGYLSASYDWTQGRGCFHAQVEEKCLKLMFVAIMQI